MRNVLNAPKFIFIFCIRAALRLRICRYRRIPEGRNRLKAWAPIRRPDQRDFRDLVETHQSRVYSIALRILGDGGLAEEVAQDVFLALYRDLGEMESDAHLLAWLRRVAVHRALDAHRRRASRIDFSAEEFHEELTLVPAVRDHVDPSFADGSIDTLVGELPAMQKAVVLLRYQEDMLPAEIATALSMPLATVKSHLQRALKLLRTKTERHTKEAAHGGA